MSASVSQLQKLFIRHTSALRGYVLAMVPDSNIVDDVLHSTFLVITAKAAEFDESREFMPWARGIARLELLRYLRESRRAPRSLAPEVIETLSLTAPAFEADEPRLAAVAACVDLLAPRAKESMLLRYTQGHSVAEIARRMEVALGTVKAMLFRARNEVRKCVERKLGIEVEP